VPTPPLGPLKASAKFREVLLNYLEELPACRPILDPLSVIHFLDYGHTKPRGLTYFFNLTLLSEMFPQSVLPARIK